MFDETGAVLALRSDMTVPIARVVASRYATAEPPLRFCYLAHCYRGVRPQRGLPRELLQAGIELIGAPAPQGTAEALSVLCEALEATGLADYRVGLGDASLFPAPDGGPASLGARARGACWRRLRGGTSWSSRACWAAWRLPAQEAELLLSVPQRRGGPEVLADLPGPAAEAASGMRMVHELLEPRGRGARDLRPGSDAQPGLLHGRGVRGLRPALGAPIGGGGRYDELLGRFGRELPAVGFALGVDRLHIALAGEERGTGVRLTR